MHVLSLHLADGYKIELREVEAEEWRQTTIAATGATYHGIYAKEPFCVVLKDKNDQFVAMVHSKWER